METLTGIVWCGTGLESSRRRRCERHRRAAATSGKFLDIGRDAARLCGADDAMIRSVDEMGGPLPLARSDGRPGGHELEPIEHACSYRRAGRKIARSVHDLLAAERVERLRRGIAPERIRTRQVLVRAGGPSG